MPTAERVGLAAPAFANEDRLPRIPLPSLDDSCERFVGWCEPLLTKAQLDTTNAPWPRSEVDTEPPGYDTASGCRAAVSTEATSGSP